MHFAKSEWEQYSQGLIQGKKQRAMEKHLGKCNHCLETFLSLVTTDDIQRAEESLSPWFAQDVISRLPEKARPTKVNTNANALCYYLAVACITVIFMTTGVFENLVNTIPDAPELHEEPAYQETAVFGWSDKLMTKALYVFDSIKTKD